MLGGDDDPRSFFPYSLAPLEASTATNLSFHRPPAAAAALAAAAPVPQLWSAGNRCLRHTLIPHALHALVLENVSTSRHRRTGHTGFFFLRGSQSPDPSCLARAALSSSPVASIAAEQASQTTTRRLRWSDPGHPWDLYDLCSAQNTLRQPSQVKGRKSRRLQSGSWQCLPRSGKASVPPPAMSLFDRGVDLELSKFEVGRFSSRVTFFEIGRGLEFELESEWGNG